MKLRLAAAVASATLAASAAHAKSQTAATIPHAAPQTAADTGMVPSVVAGRMMDTQLDIDRAIDRPTPASIAAKPRRTLRERLRRPLIHNTGIGRESTCSRDQDHTPVQKRDCDCHHLRGQPNRSLKVAFPTPCSSDLTRIFYEIESIGRGLGARVQGAGSPHPPGQSRTAAERFDGHRNDSKGFGAGQQHHDGNCPLSIGARNRVGAHHRQGGERRRRNSLRCEEFRDASEENT